MKKLIASTLLGLAAWANSFGQGNFVFNNNLASLVWDDFASPGTFVKAGPDLEVAVLWSANTNAVPTNIRNGLATPTNGFYVTSWSGIFTDPNFHLAQSTVAGNPIIVTTCGGTGPQVGIYFGGIHYINGTSTNQTIQLYVLGWQKAFGIDPVAAAATGAWVGWSSTTQYTLGSTLLPGGGLGNAGIGAFGVKNFPEPSTFALAGLSAAALLIFRRRQKHRLSHRGATHSCRTTRIQCT